MLALNVSGFLPDPATGLTGKLVLVPLLSTPRRFWVPAV